MPALDQRDREIAWLRAEVESLGAAVELLRTTILDLRALIGDEVWCRVVDDVISRTLRIPLGDDE